MIALLIWNLQVSCMGSGLIGIDFGSNHITASIFDGNTLDTKSKIKNLIGFDGENLVFSEVAENLMRDNPAAGIKVLKNALGKDKNNARWMIAQSERGSSVQTSLSKNGGINFNISGTELSTEEAAGLILAFLHNDLKTKIKDCTVTVPSAFGRREKLSLSSAVRMAGLNPVELIQENSASALMYSKGRKDDKKDHVFLLLNFGSSYFQVSLFTIWGYHDKEGFQMFVDVLGHEYNEEFTARKILFEVRQNMLEGKEKNDSFTERLDQGLRAAWETGKMPEEIEGVTLDSKDFDRAIEKHKKTFIETTQLLMNRTRVTLEVISKIGVIGGMGKVSRVQEIVKYFFKAKDLWLSSENPAVLGAGFSEEAKKNRISLKEVSVCDVIARVDSDLTMIFQRSSPLGTRKTVQIDVQESESLELIENCHEFVSYYKYTFSEGGPLKLGFYLDNKGVAYVASASLEGQKVRYKSDEISRPATLTEEEIENSSNKIKKLLQTNKAESAEEDYLEISRKRVLGVLDFLVEKKEENFLFDIMSEKEKTTWDNYIAELKNWKESKEYLTNTFAMNRDKEIEVKKFALEFVMREKEIKERRAIVSDIKKAITNIQAIIKMYNETDTDLEKTEIEEAWKISEGLAEWLNSKVEEQDKKEVWDKPVLAVNELEVKVTFIKERLRRYFKFTPYI